MNIESWHCPEIIFKSAHLLAAARDEANERLLEAQATDWHSFTARRFMC